MNARVENVSSFFAGHGDEEVVVVTLGPIEASLTVQAARDLHRALGTTLTARAVLAAYPAGAPT